ncbi:acetyl-CoA acetyltransferase [Rhodoligotrophos defluvii]|uniref:acetyl-CoA acetyltransferase n=1 Tax=Rhodoligotrophos defluvii TaxID=2561934 RepID=UPI0010C9D1CB|nr:acetyl-CoA acetyltransferase [Rhodoligotrophos defluvii]
MAGVYVLGGAQTDFARNWAREGKSLFDMMAETIDAGLLETDLQPADIGAAHIGNFAAELFCDQGLLGGFFAAIKPEFDGLPTARHEAACASGSIALLAAAAEIEAGRYDVACVLGVEYMRNLPGLTGAKLLGTACWQSREATEAQVVWPAMFNRLIDEYDRRYGIRYDHLAAIARNNYENARVNPYAQTRQWNFGNRAFTTDDEENPPVVGRVRRQDCGQITDGAAVVFLASRRFAESYCIRHGKRPDVLSRIEGWGHRTATMLLSDKFRASEGQPYVLPHVRGTFTDAFRRAGLSGVGDLDLLEVHDCFSMTEYMIIDHAGITAPGESWRAVEDGSIAKRGRIPVNPSGGLIGLGHPVGATGVRMLLDVHKQVTGTAGPTQVEGARRAATLNIGGSATASVCFVTGKVDGG